MKRNARVDANQKPIVKHLRKLGATVIHTHQIKNAFDLLVGFRGKLFAIEVKDKEKFPKYFSKLEIGKKRQFLIDQLTDGEKKCRMNLIKVGVPYSIVYDFKSAEAAIQFNATAEINLKSKLQRN